MSALPEFMRLTMDPPSHEPLESQRPETPAGEDEKSAGIWPWLALGGLVLCWLAEAALCSARGF